MQEKQRIAGRSKNIRSKEAVSVDDVTNESSNDKGETILQEKQRIAARSKNIKSTEAGIASNFANAFPGAVCMAGTQSESSELERQETDRSDREGSNEATYPGAVRIAGPEADSSNWECRGTIWIGSNRNVVANKTEENNEQTLIHAQVVDGVALVTAQPDS